MTYNGCIVCGTLLYEGHICHKCMKFNFNVNKKEGEAVNEDVRKHGVPKWVPVKEFTMAFMAGGKPVPVKTKRRRTGVKREADLQKLGRAKGQHHIDEY